MAVVFYGICGSVGRALGHKTHNSQVWNRELGTEKSYEKIALTNHTGSIELKPPFGLGVCMDCTPLKPQAGLHPKQIIKPKICSVITKSPLLRLGWWPGWSSWLVGGGGGGRLKTCCSATLANCFCTQVYLNMAFKHLVVLLLLLPLALAVEYLSAPWTPLLENGDVAFDRIPAIAE
jgi:hypothetical protein